MKRIIAGALCCCLLFLFAGCKEKRLGAQTGELSLPLGFPEKPLSTDGVYVNLPRSASWDIYPIMDARMEFLVLSREQPDESQDHYFGIDLYGCNTKWEHCNAEYPFWLYQTYRGMDWEKLGTLRAAAESGDSDAAAEFEAYQNAYRADYEALKPEELPAVYGSIVTIDAQDSSVHEKQYREILFTMDDADVAIPVGKLNLHRDSLNEGLPAVDQEIRMERQKTVQTSYWSDTAPLPEITVPAEAFDQRWSSLSLLGAALRFETLLVQLGNGGWQSWDGKTAMDIPAGTEVHIAGTIVHHGEQNLGYCADCFLVLSREGAAGTQRLWYPVALTQSWNPYELYALVEDGLDLAPYYAYAQGYEKTGLQPQETEKCIADFQPAVLRNDAQLQATLTNVTWDDFAYTIWLKAENKTEAQQCFEISKLAVNGFQYGNSFPELSVPAGKTVELAYALPWNELNRWGVTADSGEEIFSLEIFELNLASPDPWQKYPVYPMGDEKAAAYQNRRPEGPLLMENEDYALYYNSSAVVSSCPVSAIKSDPIYRLGLILVNKQELRRGYELKAIQINGKSCDAGDVKNLEPGCCQVVYLDIDYTNISGLSGAVLNSIEINLLLTDNHGVLLSDDLITVNPEFSLPSKE